MVILLLFHLLQVFVWGAYKRPRELTWMTGVLLLGATLGLAFTVLLSLATIPVYLTGEPTQHAQKNAAWYDRDRVREHEEKAETGFIAVLVTGAIGLAALWLRRAGRLGNGVVNGVVLLGVLASAGLFAIAALEGGQIRHEELRPAAIMPAVRTE